MESNKQLITYKFIKLRSIWFYKFSQVNSIILNLNIKYSQNYQLLQDLQDPYSINIQNMAKNKKKSQKKNKEINNDSQVKLQEIKSEQEMKNDPQQEIKIQQPKIEESVVQNVVHHNEQIKSEKDKIKSQQQSKQPVISIHSLQQQQDKVLEIEEDHLDGLKCRSQSKNKKKKNKKKKKEKSEHALTSQNQSVEDAQSRQKSQKKSQTFSDKVKEQKFNIFQKFIKLKANLNNQKPKQHSKFLDKVADKIVQNATQLQNQQDKKIPINRQIKKIKKPEQEIKHVEPKQEKTNKKQEQFSKISQFNDVVIDHNFVIQTPQKPKTKLLTFSSMKEDDLPILEPTQQQFDLQLESEQLKAKHVINSDAFSKKIKKINFQPLKQQIQQVPVNKVNQQLISKSNENQQQIQEDKVQLKQNACQQTLQTQSNNNELLQKIQITLINSENQSVSEEKNSQKLIIQQNETLIQVPYIRFNLVPSQQSSSEAQKNQNRIQQVPQININYVKSEGSLHNSQHQQIPDIKINYAKSETSQQNNQIFQHIQFKIPYLEQEIISQSWQKSEGRNRSESLGQLVNLRNDSSPSIKKRQSEKQNKNLYLSQSLKKAKQNISSNNEKKRLSQQLQVSQKIGSSSQLKSQSNQENLIQSYNFGEQTQQRESQNNNEKINNNQFNENISVLQRLGQLFQQQQSKKQSRKKQHEHYFGQDVGEDSDLIKQVTQSQQYQFNQDNDDLAKSKQIMQQSQEMMNLSLSDSNYLEAKIKNENKQNQQMIQLEANKIEQTLNFMNSNESQAFILQLSNIQLQKNESTPLNQLKQKILINNFQTQESIKPNQQKQDQQKQIITTEQRLPINSFQNYNLKGANIEKQSQDMIFKNNELQYKTITEKNIILNKIQPQIFQTQTLDQQPNIEELVLFQKQIITTIQNKKPKMEPSFSLGLNDRGWKPIVTKLINQQAPQDSSNQTVIRQEIVRNQTSSDKNDLRKNYYFTKYDPKQSLSLTIMNVDVNNIATSPQKKQDIPKQQQSEFISRNKTNKESFILKNPNQSMTKSFIKKRTFKNTQVEQGQNKKRNIQESKSKFTLNEQQNLIDQDHVNEMQDVNHIIMMQQSLLKNSLTNNRPPSIIENSSQKNIKHLRIDLSMHNKIPLPNPTLNQSPDKKRPNLSSRSATKLKEQMTIQLEDNIVNPLTFRQNNHASPTKLNNTGHFYSHSGQIYETQSRNNQQIQPTRLNYDNFKQGMQEQKNKPRTQHSGTSSHKLFPSNFKFAAQQIESIEIQKLDQMGSLQMDSFKQFYRQINNKDKNYYEDDQTSNYQQKQDTLILQNNQKYVIPTTQTKKSRDNKISLYTDQKLTPQSNQPKQIFFKQSINHQNYDRQTNNVNSNFNPGKIPFLGINSLALGAMNIANHFNPMKKMHTIDNKQKPIVKISYNKKVQNPIKQQSKNQIERDQSKSKSNHKKITLQLKQKHESSINKHQKSENIQEKSYKINLYEKTPLIKRQKYQNLDQTDKKFNERKDFHQQNYNSRNIDDHYKSEAQQKQRNIIHEQQKSNRKIQITFSSRVQNQNHKNQQNEINQAQLQSSKQKIHIKLQDQTKKYTLKQQLFKEKLKKTIGIKAVNNHLPSKIQQKIKGKKQKLTLNQANYKTKAQQSTVQNGQGQTFNSLQQPKYVKVLKDSVQKLNYNKHKNILQSAKKRISSNSRSRMSQYSKQKERLITDNLNLESPSNKMIEQHNKYVTQKYYEYSYSADKSQSSRRSRLSKWNDQISSLKKSREVHGKASPKIFNQSRHPAQRIIGITKWNQNISEYKKQYSKQRSRSKSSKYQSRISSKYEVRQINKSNQHSNSKNKGNLNGSYSKIGVQIKKHKYQTNNIKMHYL